MRGERGGGRRARAARGGVLSSPAGVARVAGRAPRAPAPRPARSTAPQHWARQTQPCRPAAPAPPTATSTTTGHSVVMLQGLEERARRAPARPHRPLTSGTPPTRVDTTSSPHAAASTMAMQKASVREALRKMWPWRCAAQQQAGGERQGRDRVRRCCSTQPPEAHQEGGCVLGGHWPCQRDARLQPVRLHHGLQQPGLGAPAACTHTHTHVHRVGRGNSRGVSGGRCGRSSCGPCAPTPRTHLGLQSLTDEDVHVGVRGAHVRQGQRHQVHALAVHQAGQQHHHHGVRQAVPGPGGTSAPGARWCGARRGSAAGGGGALLLLLLLGAKATHVHSCARRQTGHQATSNR